MSQANREDQVYVHIDGDISGQVAIGNNILQIGDVNGGIVTDYLYLAVDSSSHHFIVSSTFDTCS